MYPYQTNMELPLSSIDQALNILSSLVCMQATKYIHITPPILWTLRIAYVLSQAILLYLLMAIKRRITKSNDRRTVRVPREVKWNELPDPSDEEYEEMTYTDYDLRERKKMLKSTLFQVPIVLFLHLKFGLPHPLALQVISLVKAFFLCPLFLCYVRGREIERPYDKNMLFGRRVETRSKDDEEDVGRPAASDGAVSDSVVKEVSDAVVKEVDDGAVSEDALKAAATSTDATTGTTDTKTTTATTDTKTTTEENLNDKVKKRSVERSTKKMED